MFRNQITLFPLIFQKIIQNQSMELFNSIHTHIFTSHTDDLLVREVNKNWKFCFSIVLKI